MSIKKSVLGALSSILFAGSASGAVVCNNSSVTGTLTHGTAYGGCMIEVPAGQCRTDLTAAGCDAQYVSVGCAGDPSIGISKTNANANFSAAQLAFVSDKAVDLVIEPTLKYNVTYCVATQVVVKGSAVN